MREIINHRAINKNLTLLCNWLAIILTVCYFNFCRVFYYDTVEI